MKLHNSQLSIPKTSLIGQNPALRRRRLWRRATETPRSPEQSRGDEVGRRGMDTRILVNRYLADLKRNGKSVNTLSAYASDLKQFSLNNSQLSEGFSPASRLRKLTTIKNFLSWVHQKGYSNTDLSTTIVIEKQQPNHKTTILTVHQIARLRQSADIRERLLIELILQTGMSLDQTVILKMKAVDLEKSTLKLSPKNGDEAMVAILLTTPLQQALEYYLAATSRGPKSTLFASKKTGKSITYRSASTLLKNLGLKAGVKGVCARNLRATFIVRQLEGGLSPSLIGQLVGHRSPMSIQKYLQYSKGTKPVKIKLSAV